MDIKELRKRLRELYVERFKVEPEGISGLPISGSNRKYFRLTGGGKTVIGTYNADLAENRAFYYLASHLKKNGVNVPEVIIKDEENGIYLQEDLGVTTLYDFIKEKNDLGEVGLFNVYKEVVDQMPLIQFESARNMDFSICYPRHEFDYQSVQWDLNYFKYCFLKLAYIPFHEQKLESEFQKLISFVIKAPSDFFLYRDFQSRNIMIQGDNVYFVDFQGGRKGALQYDLASLLYESKVGLTQEFRQKVLDYYLKVFSAYEFFNADNFLKYYHSFALIRILQAFGAYGYRGIFEKKAFFVHSIAKGLENLNYIVSQSDIKDKFPYLCSISESMMKLKADYEWPVEEKGLTVTINSFSYRKPLPDDWSGNGGGHVFDCRSLPNPGRYEQYRSSTGIDRDVIDFMEKEKEVEEFKLNTQKIVAASVRKYLEDGFTHLSVSFGCTGGQHRSVYAAQNLFEYLRMNFDVNLRLIHREQNIREFYGKNNVQEK